MKKKMKFEVFDSYSRTAQTPLTSTLPSLSTYVIVLVAREQANHAKYAEETSAVRI